MIPFTLDQLRTHLNRENPTNKVDTLARIGETLLLVQNVERTLRFVTTFVLQRGSEGLNIEAYQQQTKAEREKTIGYFLSQIRFRADVQPDVSARLADFLEVRNQFVHRLSEVPGWGLSDETSIRSSNEYLSDVMAKSLFVFLWMSGLIRSWQIQIGLSTPFDDSPVTEILDKSLVPFADWSLAPKGDHS